MRAGFLALVLAPVGAALAGGGGAASPSAAPVFGYNVMASWPHDRSAYTEGLAFAGGLVYESTGPNARSSVRKVELRTGRVLKAVALRRGYFAEGLTIFRGRVFQSTLGRTAFVYDRGSLQRLRTFSYAGGGWGLTHYGNRLVLSDGTSTLRFLDPSTFAERRTVTVRDDGRSVMGLNELELVDGAICANIFPTDRVACLDPASGRVRYWIDLAGLLPPSLRPGDEEAVANGIAYGGNPGWLLVTGKLWPRLFQIRLVRKS